LAYHPKICFTKSEGSNESDSPKDKGEFQLNLRGTKRKPRCEEVDSESADSSADPESVSYIIESQSRRRLGETSTRVPHASSQSIADKDENDEIKTAAYSSAGPHSSISSDSIIAGERERVLEVQPHGRSRDAVLDTSSPLSKYIIFLLPLISHLTDASPKTERFKCHGPSSYAILFYFITSNLHDS
jgi:hypothetical protein